MTFQTAATWLFLPAAQRRKRLPLLSRLHRMAISRCNSGVAHAGAKLPDVSAANTRVQVSSCVAPRLHQTSSMGSQRCLLCGFLHLVTLCCSAVCSVLNVTEIDFERHMMEGVFLRSVNMKRSANFTMWPLLWTSLALFFQVGDRDFSLSKTTTITCFLETGS